MLGHFVECLEALYVDLYLGACTNGSLRLFRLALYVTKQVICRIPLQVCESTEATEEFLDFLLLLYDRGDLLVPLKPDPLEN